MKTKMRPLLISILMDENNPVSHLEKQDFKTMESIIDKVENISIPSQAYALHCCNTILEGMLVILSELREAKEALSECIKSE